VLFTFETPASNVFFRVIDLSRATENMYFHNAVTEQDLMALAERPNDTTPSLFSPLNTEDNREVEASESQAGIESQSSDNGTMIFIVLAIIVVGGAGYYFKIVRPKKQNNTDDEDDEYDGDDNESEIDYDDEYVSVDE